MHHRLMHCHCWKDFSGFHAFSSYCQQTMERMIARLFAHANIFSSRRISVLWQNQSSQTKMWANVHTCLEMLKIHIFGPTFLEMLKIHIFGMADSRFYTWPQVTRRVGWHDVGSIVKRVGLARCAEPRVEPRNAGSSLGCPKNWMVCFYGKSHV